MARQSERKQETRLKLRQAASKGFRKNGFFGVGVDAIAKDAGATSGAFYAHLGSKDGAFARALEDGLAEVCAAIPRYQQAHGTDWPRAFASDYLSHEHRRDMACGCAMTTLSPDIARGDGPLKALFEQHMTAIVDLIADGLASDDIDTRRARAWSFLSTLIGGLTLARAVKTRQQADSIACNVIDAAVALAGEAGGARTTMDEG